MKSMIKNGVPWTDGDEALLTDLSKEEQQVILDWIKENMGVGVLFEENNIYTLSSEGEMMLSVLASFAQEEAVA